MRDKSWIQRHFEGLLWGGILGLVLPAISAAQAPSPVTYAKDVAPILQEKCQACHRSGSVAPMSLLTYEDARSWAPMIREQVSKRIMPPWPIDTQVGIQQFKNDRSLSDLHRWATVRTSPLRSNGPCGERIGHTKRPSAVLRIW